MWTGPVQLFKALRPCLQQLGEENRAFIETGSLRLYDAPVAILMTMHKNFPRSRFMDLGMAAQNLMLAAHGRGLGTCAIGLALLYEEVIRAELPISPEFDCALIMALGYPDESSPVNGFRSPREDLAHDGTLDWCGRERLKTALKALALCVKSAGRCLYQAGEELLFQQPAIRRLLPLLYTLHTPRYP